MCGLTLAWVTSENSTSNWNAGISRLNLLRWTLSCLLLSPESTASLRGSTPTLFAVPSLCCPVTNCSRPGPVVNCLPAPLSSQLSFASPYHFRIRRDFRSKNPLSGFAPKQTKESSAQATHIVLHLSSLLLSLESTASVRGSTPTLLLTRLSAVPSPTTCQLLFPANSLSRPLTTSGYGEISGPKILCLVSRQNRQRNRLLGGPPI